MMSSETITASSRRVVTIALRRAAEIGHRDDLSGDSEATALVREAYDFLSAKGIHLSHRDPLFVKSKVCDEEAAAEVHLSEFVRMINMKDRGELIRIVAVSLSHEMSLQLKYSGHHQAGSSVVHLIRATA